MVLSSLTSGHSQEYLREEADERLVVLHFHDFHEDAAHFAQSVQNVAIERRCILFFDNRDG